MNELNFGKTSNAKEMAASARWMAGAIAAVAPLQASVLIGLAVLEGLAPVFSIYVTQHLIDAVIQAAGRGSEGFDAVVPWIVAFAASLLLAHDVLWKFRDPVLTRLRQKLQQELERRRLVHASALPLTFFEESASYDRLTRSSDPGRKTSDMFLYVLTLGKGVISVIGVAAIFWNVSPWLAVALVAVIVPRAVHGAKSSRKWMSFTYDQTEEQRRASYVSGLLTGRAEQKEMRVFDLSGTLSGRWESLRREQRTKAMQVKKGMELRGIPSSLLYWITETAVVVALGLWLAPQRITPGIFMSLFQGVGKMNAGAGSISFGIGILHKNAIDVGYVREFLQIPVDERTRGERLFPAPLTEGIRLNGVSFSYPGRERPILQRLDLHLRPGERVALVGENGAGKSTLVKLLLGLYKPDEGTLTADGVDYADISPESLHENVCAAYQDYYKFAFTAAQSVALGETAGAAAADGPEKLERIKQAAARGGADEFITELPQGYDTPIGRLYDGSRELSEGQWQRIAISRTFMRDPQLLVLDEPTAALDAKAEADIYGQFVSAATDRAVLLISHRLGSARLADRIIVLQDGRIAEDGNHEQLIAAKGAYAQMWEVQSGWYR
ncbi:ABC transporter ATP-binding protein [Paenibacillus hemerocallicola]|uniref:ABC transporter ATP-binding protein n=1 Tax=Paenibacillus hemerocallicola TaxID=1172614 RepID=A0A5C4T5R2_9BACL|nr:ABC transporter ATP-binding protein [Paenibacillus hemerocallicola]TNJ64402.1 ABC transporter ATP-binding protein [Paenibacillus hemerocallicola]